MHDGKTEVHTQNITHNLGRMAEAVGLYRYLWHPEEINVTLAGQLREPLIRAINELESHPEKYSTYDSPNGWGTYKHFLPWLGELLRAANEYPEASIEVSR